MGDMLEQCGSCPRCGAPIFAKPRTENPVAVRTCPAACDFSRPSVQERQLQESESGF